MVTPFREVGDGAQHWEEVAVFLRPFVGRRLLHSAVFF